MSAFEKDTPMMWCMVSQPNCVILEIDVEGKATGQECLDKVCKKLGIIEEDYFGLQYRSAKGEELWLNLRNQIRRQIAGPPPYRFALRVKFWVPPHLVLQDATRKEFYLQVKLDLAEGRLHIQDDALHKMVALIAQVETGDYSPVNAAQHGLYGTYANIEDPSDEFIERVTEEHIKLEGKDPSAAKYWVLKEASNLENFGHEMFHVKTNSGNSLYLGVGPQGITINDDYTQKQSIPYTAIHMATHTGKCFFLSFFNLNGERDNLALKLETSGAANGLYRAITEKHAFYSCETVRSAVTAQFIRDLKGTIASFFNENTAVGKKYVFDIRRTCREVYDDARRKLYRTGASVTPQVSRNPSEETSIHCVDCDNAECKMMKEQFVTVHDAMICKICMDNEINTVFCPCGHVICQECAARCERCPLCRADISQTQVIYLPMLWRTKGRPENSEDSENNEVNVQ